MPFKKVEIPPKCEFCGKTKYKMYMHNLLGRMKIFMCGRCKDLYHQCRFAFESGGNNLLLKILSFSRVGEKHCFSCKKFNKSTPEKCKRSMWTGMGDKHLQIYPLSFANHGCSYYEEV